MRIAHLSDPHVLELAGASGRELWGTRRLVGMFTMLGHRTGDHRPGILRAMVDDIARSAFDHVVVTGDLTVFGLDAELEAARATLDRIGLAPKRVSIIPGNHDMYTPASVRDRLFVRHFGNHITSDIPIQHVGHPSGPFPFVRLVDGVAIIGLSSAVVRSPLSSAGRLGARQIAALRTALQHSEVRARFPVILIHHPMINPKGKIESLSRGLDDAPELREVLRSAKRPILVLHGHWHERRQRILDNLILHVGAASASLLHPSHRRMAGYNIYEVQDGKVTEVSSRVWSARSETFENVVMAPAEHA